VAARQADGREREGEGRGRGEGRGGEARKKEKKEALDKFSQRGRGKTRPRGEDIVVTSLMSPADRCGLSTV
jgi:hypothetical protein